MELLLAFLAGLLIGSFLNVCIYRLPRDLSVAKPARSFCPGCETTIAWYDNIPLVSYALLGGKSRCCQQRIPTRYPLVECVTGVFFALSVWMFGVTLEALKYAIFSAIMIDLMFTDFEERILPDEFTLGGAVVGLVLAWFVPLSDDILALILSLEDITVSPQLLSVSEAAFAGLFCGGLLWFVAWAFEKIRHKEGMGMGDMKMMLVMGAFLGLRETLFTFFLASLVGSVVGILFIWLAKKEAGSYELPFGSFLGAMSLVTAFWLR